MTKTNSLSIAARIIVKDTRWLMTDAYYMGDMRCPEPYDVPKMM
jgi:hypothetical protein